MGQRDTRHNHANTRHKLGQLHASRGQKNHELEERAPLIGHESLYEISRRGTVFPLNSRVVPLAGYHHSPFIRIVANGAVVTLPKEQTIARSFAARAEKKET